MAADVPLLVSTEWLAARLGEPGVRALDVRWALLEKGRGRAAYREGHVPGAAFVDVDADLASPPGRGPGRHPLPEAQRFTAAMSRAGVGPHSHVIAYDFGDGSTAARLWWLLRSFGHDRVSLLDGGIARWVAEGRPLESGEPPITPGAFWGLARRDQVVNAEQVERLAMDPRVVILDARAPERYQGKSEPIDPVAGHIPGAANHPYADNLRGPDDPRFLDAATLHRRFQARGVERAPRVVCYCGSGVNACQNVFALALAGFDNAVLYEGSWSDWCLDPKRGVTTGPEP